MKRAQALPSFELFIEGLDETISETDIRNHFYQYGEIRQVNYLSPFEVSTRRGPNFRGGETI